MKALSRILLIIGVVCIVVSATYMVANYPWQVDFSSDEELTNTLPEPGLLPETVILGKSGTAESGAGDSQLTKLGTIKIPKIALSENIVEGSGEELLYGVGHIPDTPKVGSKGNSVLAGHLNYVRMHPFRHLDKVDVGDKVFIQTEDSDYVYEVYKTFEVTPEDSWVLEEQPDEDYVLTLVTCTPVINPINRLILWCRLVDSGERK